jgi:hypothetical protein
MTHSIAFNTLTGAVSEYSGFGFQSLTSTLAGSATGLFALGGDTDAGLPIVATVTTGRQLWGGTLKKTAQMVYFSLKGSGTSTMTVTGENASHSYPFPVRPDGQSRSKPGLGIRENYLAFGYSNTDGADFQLDRIEVLVAESKNRRV